MCLCLCACIFIILGCSDVWNEGKIIAITSFMLRPIDSQCAHCSDERQGIYRNMHSSLPTPWLHDWPSKPFYLEKRGVAVDEKKQLIEGESFTAWKRWIKIIRCVLKTNLCNPHPSGQPLNWINIELLRLNRVTVTGIVTSYPCRKK